MLFTELLQGFFVVKMTNVHVHVIILTNQCNGTICTIFVDPWTVEYRRSELCSGPLKPKTSLNKIVFLASLLNMHPLEDIANTE
jgi:hypothetical protein